MTPPGSPHWLKDYDVLILSKANMTTEDKSRTWLNRQFQKILEEILKGWIKG